MSQRNQRSSKLSLYQEQRVVWRRHSLLILHVADLVAFSDYQHISNADDTEIFGACSPSDVEAFLSNIEYVQSRLDALQPPATESQCSTVVRNTVVRAVQKCTGKPQIWTPVAQ